MEEEKNCDSGDTIYEFKKGAPAELVKAATDPFKLPETTVEGRKAYLAQQMNEAKKKASLKKKAVKAGTTIMDHWVEVLAMVERSAFGVVVALLMKQQWGNAFLVFVIFLLFWVWKVRNPDPGPLVKFLRQEPKQIRAMMADWSKTIYKG